jgi:hypothetical protein
MSAGYVYILSNPLMPGLLKIGKTTRDVAGRANELYQTGVPGPFKIEFDLVSPDCHRLEVAMHSALSKDRVDPGREFFSVDVAKATQTLIDLHREQVEEWLAYFLPDHSPTPDNEYIDPVHFYWLADEIGEYVPNIFMALDYLKADELRPALERFKARRERMRQENENPTETIKLVGDQ